MAMIYRLDAIPGIPLPVVGLRPDRWSLPDQHIAKALLAGLANFAFSGLRGLSVISKVESLANSIVQGPPLVAAHDVWGGFIVTEMQRSKGFKARSPFCLKNGTVPDTLLIGREEKATGKDKSQPSLVLQPSVSCFGTTTVSQNGNEALFCLALFCSETAFSGGIAGSRQ